MDRLLFAEDDDSNEILDEIVRPAGKWKILIVDDEQDVHDVTVLALKRLEFESRGLEFLSAYSARKLGMQSTGNAGGCHNLIVKPGRHNFDGLLKKMGRGLVVTELLGQGVNYVNGDYSRGAAGFWVEDGKIVHAVEEITIAGNLRDMFRHVAAVGNDVLVRGSKQVGSLLIEQMKVAGN